MTAVGFAALAILGPVAAVHASEHRFNRVVGWSNILAFSVAAAGFALMVGDRNRRKTVTGEALAQSADQLMERVLREEGLERGRLLGTDATTVTAANVGFDLVQYEDAATGARHNLRAVAGFYQQETPGRLVVLGSPGSGKTVLALELLVRLMEQRKARRRDGGGSAGPVAVRLSLPTWNTDQPFTGWLADQLSTRYGLTPQIAGDLVSSGYVLPVLDGLDEMDPETGKPVRAVAAVAQLNEYISGASGAPLVITCRTDDYARISKSVQPAATIRIRPLDTGQITDYLLREVRYRDGQAAWSTWGELVRRLADPADSRVRKLLQTPWHLILAVTFYRDGGNPADLLPAPGEPAPGDEGEDADQYYRHASGILLDAYIPARTRLYGQGDYDPDEARSWLVNVARYLRDRGDIQQSSSDLVLTECWPIAGADRVRRWHAATATILVLIAVVFLSIQRNGGWHQSIANVHYYMANFPHLPRTFLVQGLLVILATIVVPLLVARRSLAPPRRAYLINFQQLRTRQGRRKLAGGLAVGLAVGVATGVVFGVASGLAFGVASGVATGLALGLALGLTVGLASGLEPIGNSTVSDPRDAIRSDLAVGVASGVAIGLAIGLVAGLVGGLGSVYATGLLGGFAGVLAGGLAIGLAGGLAIQADVAYRYLIATSCAASTGLLPLRFGRFLDWAHHAGILRISGNAYQFRHSELRDRLQCAADKPDVTDQKVVPEMDPIARSKERPSRYIKDNPF